MRPRRGEPGRFRWRMAALLLAWLVLAACSTAPPGLADVYAPVVRPEYAPLLTELTGAPRIDMEVWYQPTRNHLEGRMQVSGVNLSGDTWTQLVFRLYPNLIHVGGRLVLERGTVRNALVPFKLAADDTAAVFLLPTEEWIRPGRPFEIELVWSLDLPVFSEVSSVYVPFGQMLGFHAAPWFYPVLAHYVPTSPAAPGHWWLETAPTFADILYSPASFFRVQLWMPEGYPPVTPGVEQERTGFIHNCPHQVPWSECTEEDVAACPDRLAAWECQPAPLIRYSLLAGPVPEFSVITHAGYESTSFDAGGVLVTSWWVPAYGDTGLEARDFAVAALRAFEEEFGPYPWPTLTVAMAPLANSSMELPQVSLIGVQLYRAFASDLELEIAFSVAHQWWSQLVQNDPVNAPWLDEALSTLAVLLYQERLHGEDTAAVHRIRKLEIPVQRLQSQDRDGPVDLRVHDYVTGTDYRVLVRAKGALFLDHFRERSGARAFRRMLTEFVESNRFGLIDSDALLDRLWETNATAMILYQDAYFDPVRHR